MPSHEEERDPPGNLWRPSKRPTDLYLSLLPWLTKPSEGASGHPVRMPSCRYSDWIKILYKLKSRVHQSGNYVDRQRREVSTASILLQQWKTMSVSLRLWSIHSFSDSVSDCTFESIRRTPSEFLVAYVGTDRRRSVIPTRLLNLLIFVALLNKVEEEFRLHSGGGLVFPCEVGFFKEILRFFGEG